MKTLAFRIVTSFIAKIFFGFILSLILVSASLAQSTRGVADIYTPAQAAPGAPAGSDLISNFENVNLFSGNLSFSMPLYEYSGRGDVSHTQRLTIERQWHVSYFSYAIYQAGGTWQVYDYLWNGGGQSTTGRMSGRRSRDTNPTSDNSSCSTLTRLVWIEPDGTEHEMRDLNTNGTPHYSYGANSYSRGTVFVSRDGSNLTFVSDTNINDVNCATTALDVMNGPVSFTPTGVLYFPNGTTLRSNGGWKDRNGNSDSIGRVPGRYGFGGVEKKIIVRTAALSQRLRADQTSKTGRELFPQMPADGGGTNFNFDPNRSVTSEAELPNGKKYQFYYNSYAELARVISPTGAATEYDYVQIQGNQSGIKRRLSQRRLYSADGSLETKTVYGSPGSSTFNNTVYNNVRVDIYDGQNHLLNTQVTVFYGDYYNNSGGVFYPNPLDGKIWRVEDYTTAGTLLKRVETTWQVQSSGQPYLQQTVTTLADTNQVSKQTFAYDGFLNQTDEWVYDYGTGAPSTTLLRHTHTDYVTDPAYTDYTGVHLKNLPLQTYVSSDYNGAQKLALTVYEYDVYTGVNHAALLPRSNVYGFDTAYDGNTPLKRGNLTAIKRYVDAQSQTGEIATYMQYLVCDLN